MLDSLPPPPPLSFFLLLGVWVGFLVIMIRIVECGRPEMFSLLTDSGSVKPVPSLPILLAQMGTNGTSLPIVTREDGPEKGLIAAR